MPFCDICWEDKEVIRFTHPKGFRFYICKECLNTILDQALPKTNTAKQTTRATND